MLAADSICDWRGGGIIFRLETLLSFILNFGQVVKEYMLIKEISV